MKERKRERALINIDRFVKSEIHLKVTLELPPSSSFLTHFNAKFLFFFTLLLNGWK